MVAAGLGGDSSSSSSSSGGGGGGSGEVSLVSVSEFSGVLSFLLVLLFV